ncbi:hypothetical protein AB1N83_003266 [Pleurotus pulmonarius]
MFSPAGCEFTGSYTFRICNGHDSRPYVQHPRWTFILPENQQSRSRSGVPMYEHEGQRSVLQSPSSTRSSHLPQPSHVCKNGFAIRIPPSISVLESKLPSMITSAYDESKQHAQGQCAVYVSETCHMYEYPAAEVIFPRSFC